jgi:hypothetical protein
MEASRNGGGGASGGLCVRIIVHVLEPDLLLAKRFDILVIMAVQWTQNGAEKICSTVPE